MAAEAEPVSQQRNAPQKRSRTSWGPSLLVVGLLAFVSGGLWTERYRAQPEPLRPVTGWRWWITPVERNAFLRLPAIQGALNGVHAFDAQTVWAVGAHDLIVGTTDGGKTWRRGTTPAALPPAQLAGPGTGRTVRTGPPAQAAPPTVRTPAKDAAPIALPPPPNAAPAGAPPAQEAAPTTRPPAKTSSLGFIAAAYAAAPPNPGTDVPSPAGELNVPLDSSTAPNPPPQSVRQASPEQARPSPPTQGPVGQADTSQSRPRPRAPTLSIPNQPEMPTAQSKPSAADELADIRFLTSKVGIAVGARGTVLRTVDGGSNWSLITASTTADLHALAIVGAARLVAVGGGENGETILTSDDQGLTWRVLQTGPRPGTLWSVAFFDANNGVAVGSYGTTLKTRDGGVSWTSRKSGTLFDLYGVAFRDPAHGIAVGDGGVVLQSDDGGETWRPSGRVSGNANLHGVLLLDSRRLMALGPELLISDDGGRRWQPGAASSSRSLSFNAAALASDGSVYAVGPSGNISRSTDGGRSWLPISSPPFHSMAFTDAQRGILVGDRGTVLATKDGGKTWSARDSRVGSSLFAVAFSGTAAVAVGEKGTMLISRDGGESWESQQVGYEVNRLVSYYDMLDVAFAGDRRGFAVGESAPMLESTDGGLKWSPRTDPAPRARSLAFLDPQHGFLAQPEEKTFALTADGGSTWTPESLPTDAVKVIPLTLRLPFTRGHSSEYALVTSQGQLMKRNGAEWVRSKDVQPSLKKVSAAAFSDTAHGIVLGQGGTVLRTDNGGDTWSVVPTFTTLNFTGVRFTSETHAIAIGQGRVFLTSDAGQTWSAVPYRRYPSPWLWVGTLVLLSVPVIVFRRRASAAIEAQPSVTDAVISDSPMGWRDPDVVGLKEIARGLSRFIRNQRTQPPLTIGITGEWGSGKSSLMNLLKEDLQRYGFRPVWFNAWHHQSGENLLASLLANIHAQGIPSWLTLAGIDFRLSLLWVRLRRFWLRLSITLFAIVIAFYTYDILGMNAARLWQTLTSATPLGLEHLGAATGLLSLIVAMLTPFIGAIRVVSAFGLRPGKLIASVATMSDEETAHLQPGARYRFAREFRDFTRALEPRTLVVFIDDLDRCRPPNVIEVLEGVNFLISSGPCVVVLGMARPWVEACVGEAFRELAAAGADAPSNTDARQDRTSRVPDQDPGLEQRQFARNYLEKMLNIEVPIPKLTEQAAETLLRTGGATVPDEHARLRRFLSGLGPFAAVLLVAGFIYAIGYQASKGLERLNSVIEARAIANQQAITGIPAPAAASGNPAAEPTVPIATDRDEGPADVEAPSAPVSAGWYLGAGVPALLAVCALIAVVLLVRRRVRTDDSQNFRRALAVLRPWILVGGDSPRSLKRFVNSLRYIAMRFRTSIDPPTLWERILARVQGRFTAEPQAELSPARVPLEEPLLVALAAIHRCNKRWLDVRTRMNPDTIDMLLARDMADRFPDAGERRRVVARLAASIDEFNDTFPETPLYKDEIQDRRHIVAFCDAMASEAAAPEPFLPEKPSPPTQLRST